MPKSTYRPRRSKTGWIRLLAAAICLTVLLAACGGGSSSANITNTGSTPTPTTVANTPTPTAGAPDPALLASQLQLIYDGGGLAAKMDRNPGIATPARAAASALIAAALAR